MTPLGGRAPRHSALADDADEALRPGPPPIVTAVAVVGGGIVILPLVALVIRAPWSRIAEVLRAPAALDALRLSLATTLSAVVVSLVIGVPLAWVQARVRYPGRALVRAALTVPLVLPPVVGGVALLLAFGRRGVVGPTLDRAGIVLPFSTAGAVAAEVFVALPFLVLTVEGALRGVDRRIEDAARTLGAGRWAVFRTVTLPLIRPSLVAGTVLCWARALGEFGATITFAGNLRGKTQTLPLFVYTTFEGGDLDAAVVLSLVLLAVAVLVLALVR
jgi:molybdate transport system permease protein